MAIPHDTPTNDLGLSLPEYLETGNADGWGAEIIIWHITRKDDVPAILREGLQATPCGEWMANGQARPCAVYGFSARSVVEANIPHILDDPDEAAILRITIPAGSAANLYADNIYNMSLYEVADMSSVQYRGDIPAEWIEEEETPATDADRASS